METHTAELNLLENILNNEIEVLGRIYDCQKHMYQAVLVRDWIQLQKETALSAGYADTFTALEEDRTGCIRAIMSDAEGNTDFYRISACFEPSDRNRINSLFREMKRMLLLSRSENEVFNTYITNMRTVLTGMLETVMPARRNKIYSKRGSLVSTNVESLVVNRSF